MKKVIKISMYLCLLIFFSCKNINQTDERKKTDNKEQAALEYIKQLGFNTDSYDKITFEDDDYLIIEKDLMININKITNERDKHWSFAPKIVSIKEVSEITWAMGSSIEDDWLTAISNAESHWSGINNCHINIKPESIDLDSADIIIREFDFVKAFGSDYNNVIAVAEIPLDGKPGNRIKINTGFVGTLTASQKTFTMVHELGHTIGFRHTNWFDRNSDGFSGEFGDGSDADDEGWRVRFFNKASHILGTPSTYDENSVMNAYVAPWTGFSKEDIDAAKSLYFRQGALNKVSVNPIGLISKGISTKISLTHSNKSSGSFKYHWYSRIKSPSSATESIWKYESTTLNLRNTIRPTSIGQYELGVITRKMSTNSIVSISKRGYKVL